LLASFDPLGCARSFAISALLLFVYDPLGR
jgi:hypothetical protein